MVRLKEKGKYLFLKPKYVSIPKMVRLKVVVFSFQLHNRFRFNSKNGAIKRLLTIKMLRRKKSFNSKNGAIKRII